VLIPTQSVDIIRFIVQWIDRCILGVTPLTSAFLLDFTISAACTMREVNKLHALGNLTKRPSFWHDLEID
jgi:hypothetical protein